MRRYTTFMLIGLIWGVAVLPQPATAQPGGAALAYVKDNQITLADWQGNPLTVPGPELTQWQSAKLFWSPDGASLYIATRQGLFATGAAGGAAVRIPGEFGLTVAMARHGGTVYNLDTDMPQEISANTAAFPLRETNLATASGGRGRLVVTIGAYQLSTVNVNVTHAAALYARDGGLLEGGRPRLYPTYNNGLLFSCCFPDAGLGLVANGEVTPFDPTFITGAAALNANGSRLAAPITQGVMRVVDLLTLATRDYPLEGMGGYEAIERIGWALDDGAIYFILRQTPQSPLEQLPSGGSYLADTRSAHLALWQLNLVTGAVGELARFGDAFGVSSLAVTHDYVFAVLVERNESLVNALNTGLLDANSAPTDPALDAYIPRTILWRVERATGQMFALDENIWGVVARPPS